MKLLLDQNISRRILQPLLEKFPDSNQVYLLNLAESDDLAIWHYAKENDYTIVTKDSDFHEFSLIYGPPPKIIWLKCGNVGNQYILDRLLNCYEEIASFMQNNHTACLEIY